MLNFAPNLIRGKEKHNSLEKIKTQAKILIEKKLTEFECCFL